MKPPAPPLVIERPRSAEQIAAALRRLLEDKGFASTPRDPLLEALVGVASRYAEIVTGCVNDAPRLHLQAFSEVMLDQLVENKREPQLVRYALCNRSAAGTHFPRHR